MTGTGVREATAALAARLGSAAEARWMVEHVMGTGRPVGAVLDAVQCQALAALAGRRVAGEPLQYLLGSWAFRTLELRVDRRALIPRPETEQVVELALAEVRRVAAARGPEGPGPGQGAASSRLRVADLGTGTGAIALSMAVELGPAVADLEVWATDLDADALALAQENRTLAARGRPGAAAVRFVEGRWFEALPAHLRGALDVVVSNPPYVAEAEWAGLDDELHHEPRQALVAEDGSDGTPGLAAVEEVLAGARSWLRSPGAAVVELAPHQAPAATRLARHLGYGSVEIGRDLAGRQRAVVARG